MFIVLLYSVPANPTFGTSCQEEFWEANKAEQQTGITEGIKDAFWWREKAYRWYVRNLYVLKSFQLECQGIVCFPVAWI